MRRSEFFKKLNSELDGIAPVLSDELKEMPIVTAENPLFEKEVRKHPFATVTLKRVTALAASLILFVTVLLSAAGFGFADDGAIVTLSINPEVSLLVGKDMKVLRVISENPDGDILLSEKGFEDSVKGQNAALAAELIASKAEKLGYLKDGKTEDEKDSEDGGGKKIRIKIESGKAGPRKLPEEIRERLKASLKNRGMDVKVECNAAVIKKFAKVFKEKKGLNTLHYKNIKDNAEKLKEYLKEMSFDYCRDSLIRSLNEYDLYRKMDSAVSTFKESCAESYWEVLRRIKDDGDVDGYIKQKAAMITDLIERIKAVSREKADYFNNEDAFLKFLKGADRGCCVDGLRELSEKLRPEDFFGAVGNSLEDYKQFVNDDIVSGFLTDFMDPDRITVPGDMVNMIEKILGRFSGVRIAIQSSRGDVN